MLLLLIPLLVQTVTPTERQLLDAEHARSENVSVLVDGTKSTNTRIQRLAVRALGRLERPSLESAVTPLLHATDAEVRREAVNALAQMGATGALLDAYRDEKNGRVRGAMYESIGRSPPVLLHVTNDSTTKETPATMLEQLLVTGLTDADIDARTGAARGLEAMVRHNARSGKPQDRTIAALRDAMRVNTSDELRQLALLALTNAGDRDSATLAMARRDPSAQVRRLAVAASRQWLDDPAAMVRAQALRSAGTCGRAVNAIDDSSETVVLTATDYLGDHKCDASVIESLVGRGRSWRIRMHALVSLARSSPDVATKQLATFANSKDWHERLYAATTAKVLKHEATLAQLARDEQPLVAIEAMTTADDAVRALVTNHAGLLFAAANRLKDAPQLPSAVPALLNALDRLTRTGRVTVRDPRIAILQRLREQQALVPTNRLEPLLADRDPNVAALAARILSEKGGTAVRPATLRYVPAPLPSAEFIRDLAGATATIRLRGLGTITIELLNEDAPMAVATFAQLADAKRFNGLTFHRIVTNFVIQGGSPGADEYDALTDTFMRDEVGMARNARGTLGISTRGRDTGDGQIYINTVDNFRLDHDYTVFARVLSGLDVVDRVQEFDVIESIQIVRRRPNNNR